MTKATQIKPKKNQGKLIVSSSVTQLKSWKIMQDFFCRIVL